ncbi:MAG: TetR/AcrR family transcriptional regulator [Proteobacteria bacterium]|nr:TetR/AcrR family transcriptional regulator [Pseudomonadota bacterium]
MTARPRVAPKPPGRYHHGDLRAALVEASLALIDEQGLAAFTLRRVAERVGVNHRAAYRHFADRSELLAAVAQQGFQRLAAAMERTAGGRSPDPVQAVGARLRAYVRFALAHPAHYRAMFGPGSRTLGASEPLDAAVLAAIHAIERPVAAATGEAPGRVRDRVMAVWTLAHGLCDLAIAGHIPTASPARGARYAMELMAPWLREFAQVLESRKDGKPPRSV